MARVFPRVLVYVEDPGAANMALGLASALASFGGTAQILAGGTAADYLARRGEPCTPCPDANAAFTQLDAGWDLLAVGTSENPETFAFDLLQLADARGITTAGLVDGPANADRRFRGRTDNPLAFAPGRLIVPVAATRDAFAALGFDPARIDVCGHPSLDGLAARRADLQAHGKAAIRAELFPDIPPSAPLILFLAELSDGLDPAQFRRQADYTLNGRGGADGRTEIVLEEVLDAAASVDPRPNVAVRLHPKTRAEDYAGYRGDIAAFNQGGNAHAALFAADLVVGLTTALLQEAAVLGVNTLSVIPRTAEVAWLNGAERIPVVWTREGLSAALSRAFDAPERFMPEGVAEDGPAAVRTARALKAVARPVLETARLRLEPFPAELLTDRYVGWLNDPAVVRFSEQRHKAHTIESCREFVAGFRGAANGLWAIRDKSQDLRHIGNITTEVDMAAKSGDIRILIGEQSAWGTGMGLEAWTAVMAHLFDDLGLAQVTAGTMAENRGMIRIMEKAGMTETHRASGPTPLDGRPAKLVYARCLKADFEPPQEA
ncbi:MAG: GNAT family N-acetyltransferase [Rhodospirillaceae bacterium]